MNLLHHFYFTQILPSNKLCSATYANPVLFSDVNSVWALIGFVILDRNLLKLIIQISAPKCAIFRITLHYFDRRKFLDDYSWTQTIVLFKPSIVLIKISTG